jgi:hypothetical protein
MDKDLLEIEAKANALEALGWVFLIMVALGLVFFSLYVSMTLWNWHVAYYFGLMPITMWGTLGIGCAFAAFKSKNVLFAAEEILKGKYAGLSGGAKKLFYVFLVDCFLLFLGWIAK